MTSNNIYQVASQYLAAQDADWARLIAQVGDCGLVVKETYEPYEALVRAIAHQQIHARAAEAILGRFLALFPHVAFPDANDILATDEITLRACGFSASKVLTIRGIAEKSSQGYIPTLAQAQHMSDEALIACLVQLRGVGRWTVEMMLIFTLGRKDVLPIDDFGVREGYRLLKQLAEQPKPKALGVLGELWAPHRSIAKSSNLAK